MPPPPPKMMRFNNIICTRCPWPVRHAIDTGESWALARTWPQPNSNKSSILLIQYADCRQIIQWIEWICLWAAAHCLSTAHETRHTFPRNWRWAHGLLHWTLDAYRLEIESKIDGDRCSDALRTNSFGSSNLDAAPNTMNRQNSTEWWTKAKIENKSKA